MTIYKTYIYIYTHQHRSILNIYIYIYNDIYTSIQKYIERTQREGFHMVYYPEDKMIHPSLSLLGFGSTSQTYPDMIFLVLFCFLSMTSLMSWPRDFGMTFLQG